MKIEKIEIKGLFGKKDICWELNPQVNVLVGENGSGKSTILSFLYNLLLSNECNENNMFLFDSAKMIFTDKNCRQYVPISLEELQKEFLENSQEKQEKVEKLAKQGKEVKALIILAFISLILMEMEDSKNNTVKKFEKTNNSDNLYIDLIEANLSNSNSNQTIKRSNSQEENILDLEIRETIELLNKISNDELINRLSGSLNFFFNQIGKQVTYENNEWVYTDTQLQKTLNYSDLSSGERQLIYILLRVALSNGDKSKTTIMLMDEPEISLHLNWQEHFIKQLTLLNPDAQFIIVTHSPALIMNGWNDVYVDMAEITRDMEQA